MSPNQWGPPTWTLFHTLSEKIHEDMFTKLMPEIIFYMRRISSALPCPECSQHAGQFWKNINFSGIKNKNDLKNMVCLFHNIVNKRKNKPLFKHEDLSDIYSNKKIIEVYNQFVNVYQTNGNMKLLSDAFQRKLILIDFKKWLMKNFIHFL